MRIEPPALASTLALGLIAVACPTPSTPPDAGPPAPPPSVALEGFCSAVAEVTCAGFAACGCTLEGRAFTFDDCAENRMAECESRFFEVRDLVGRGEARYDDEAAAACVAGIEALAAECRRIDETALPTPCGQYLVLPAELDRSCGAQGAYALCAEGAGWCDPWTFRCEAIPSEGDYCVSGRCPEGLLCIQDGDLPLCLPPIAEGTQCNQDSCAAGLACIDGVCRARLGLDQSPCQQRSDCQDGLSCAYGTCVTAAARGEGCWGWECDAGDECVRAFAGRVCRAKDPDGTECEVSDSCQSEYCTVPELTCGQPPGLGESCQVGACADGLACDYSTGDNTCVAAPVDGEACLEGSPPCAAGLGCNDVNVCAPPGGLGTPCLSPDNLCAPGLACDVIGGGSFCVEPRGQGEHCESAVCGQGLFCDSATLQCTADHGVGGACENGTECADDLDCGDLLGFASCHEVPAAAGAPCSWRCGGGLACVGSGRVCAPEICSAP